MGSQFLMLSFLSWLLVMPWLLARREQPFPTGWSQDWPPGSTLSSPPQCHTTCPGPLLCTSSSEGQWCSVLLPTTCSWAAAGKAVPGSKAHLAVGKYMLRSQTGDFWNISECNETEAMFNAMNYQEPQISALKRGSVCERNRRGNHICSCPIAMV